MSSPSVPTKRRRKKPKKTKKRPVSAKTSETKQSGSAVDDESAGIYCAFPTVDGQMKVLQCRLPEDWRLPHMLVNVNSTLEFVEYRRTMFRKAVIPNNSAGPNEAAYTHLHVRNLVKSFLSYLCFVGGCMYPAEDLARIAEGRRFIGMYCLDSLDKLVQQAFPVDKIASEPGKIPLVLLNMWQLPRAEKMFPGRFGPGGQHRQACERMWANGQLPIMLVVIGDDFFPSVLPSQGDSEVVMLKAAYGPAEVEDIRQGPMVLAMEQPPTH